MLEQGPDFWCWFDTTQFSYIPLCSPKYVFNPNVTTFQSNCAKGLHFYFISAFIKPAMTSNSPNRVNTGSSDSLTVYDESKLPSKYSKNKSQET